MMAFLKLLFSLAGSVDRHPYTRRLLVASPLLVSFLLKRFGTTPACNA
jgi:hypothetical protein